MITLEVTHVFIMLLILLLLWIILNKPLLNTLDAIKQAEHPDLLTHVFVINKIKRGTIYAKNIYF